MTRALLSSWHDPSARAARRRGSVGVAACTRCADVDATGETKE